MRKFEVAPKPFSMVPFESNPKLGPVTGHEKFSNQMTGKALFHMETLTPFHIGSGIWEVINEEVMRDIVMSKGKVIIPGSSLKGAFRTIAETISPSCVCKTRQKNFSFKQLKECMVRDEKGKVCPACAIFGAMGYKGRAWFTDASLLRGDQAVAMIPSLYGPRPSAKIYKDHMGRYKGRKFYFHGKPKRGREMLIVINKGGLFQFEMRFENLSDNEFGLLLTSLGVLDEFVAKIGGAKPVCFGSVRLTMKQLEIRNKHNVFSSFSKSVETYENEKLSAWLGTMKNNDNPMILKNSLERLKTIWKHPSTRECPNIAY